MFICMTGFNQLIYKRLLNADLIVEYYLLSLAKKKMEKTQVPNENK